MRFSVWFLAAWLLLAGAGEADAGFLVPVFSAIGSAIGALGVFGKALLGIALNIGISLIQKALAPKVREPGIQAELSTGGDNPLTFLLGHFATPGQLEYVQTWGNTSKTPNVFLTYVISLADMPVGALTHLWVDDEACALPTMTGSPPAAPGWPVAEYTRNGVPHLYIKYYDGNQTTFDPFLEQTFNGGGADRPWGTDHIGRGVPYVILTARRNSKLFAGMPSFIMATAGQLMYDVRLDSSAGGVGSHRWNDPGTWAPSNNPIVQVYNIIRGFYFNSKWQYGGQTTKVEQLPAANWIAAMNACDESIPLVGGGSEQRYRSGAQILGDQDPLSVIESILKGCSGSIAEIAGKYKVTVGPPGLAVYSFTDASIVISEGQSFDPFPGLDETFNGARASYPEPLEKWQMKDAPAYVRSDLVPLDDNRELVSGLTFSTVPYPIQVQRLLREAIEDSRRFRRHQFYLPPEAALLEPTDVVSWSSARNSYTNKKFIVVEVAGANNCLRLVSLKEVDPADFTWIPATHQRPYSVGFLGTNRPPLQQTTGWQVFPATLTDGALTARRPSIEVRFDGDLEDIEFVRIKVRLAFNDNIVFDTTITYGDPSTNDDPRSVILNGVFLPNTDYEVQGQFISYGDRREIDPSSWLSVTTDDIRLDALDFYPGLEWLPQTLKDLQKFAGDGLRDALNELRAVSASVAADALVNFSDKQEVRQEVGVSIAGVEASYIEAINVAAGPGSAVVARIETLEVEVVNAESGLVANATAISALSASVTTLDGLVTSNAADITALTATVEDPVTGVDATSTAVNALSVTVSSLNGQVSTQASSIIALQSRVDDATADATFRMVTGYTPAAGWTARIGLQARVTSSAGYQNGGIYIDVTASAARIVLDANQVVILAGGTVAALFDSGTAYIANARIRDLDADNIRAKSINADVILLDGTLITDLIAANAVSVVSSGAMGSNVTSNTTSGDQTLCSSAVVSNGTYKAVVSFHVAVQVSVSTGNFLLLRILRNGSTLRTYSIYGGAGGATINTTVSGIIEETAGSGTSTYSLVALQAGQGSGVYSQGIIVTMVSKK